MKVFKFGGASVKSADAVRNVAKIIEGNDNLVVVISAMGKTTNLMESLVKSYFNNDGKAAVFLLNLKHFILIFVLNFLKTEQFQNQLFPFFRSWKTDCKKCLRSIIISNTTSLWGLAEWFRQGLLVSF